LKELIVGEEGPSKIPRWNIIMHELSIAQNILEIVQQYVPPDHQSNVKSVTVKIGDLAGVVPESLEFCFAAITTETPFKNVRLTIERIPFTLLCPTCHRTSSNDAGIALCPACGSSQTTIVSGTELHVSEIELDDEPVEAV
jgi:hydrogenase nickel incorporation protein HypA/HybF